MKFHIDKSKDNYDILKVDKDEKSLYIGSKYCEKREIEKFIKDIEPTVDKNYIVFGLATGEHIRELLKYIGFSNKILIIEPSEELYKFVVKQKIIKDIISDSRITIAFNREDINKFFEKNVSGVNVDSYIAKVYINYEKIFKEDIGQLYLYVKENIQKAVTERNTQLYFVDTWTNGFFEILKNLKETSSLDVLKDKYKDIPAIIVSAGPSLKKNIKHLSNFKNGLVISGGRTLNSLKEIDVEPDALVVVDPGDVSYTLVSDYIKTTDIPLFFYEGTNAQIIKEHKGKKVMCSDNSFINNILGHNNESINKGGSVAHSMTFLAAYMGCNPIVFIGQDLAYTNGQLHCDITMNKGQNYTAKDFARGDDVVIKDIYGNDVLTSVLFNGFKLELEKIISSFPNIDFIDSTEGGAYIEGTVVMDLKEAISKFESFSFKKIEDHLLDIDLTNKIIEELNKAKNTIYIVRENLPKGIEYLKQLINAYKINDNRRIVYLNKKIDSIDKIIKENIDTLSIFANDIYRHIYLINTSEEYKVNMKDDRMTVLNKKIKMNIDIYQKLELVFHNNISLIEKTIEDINSRRI